MKNVTELDVYNLAEELSDIIWYGYDGWNYKTQKSIGLQVIGSSDSIAANIIEGFGRFTPPDRKNSTSMQGGPLKKQSAGYGN